VLIELVINLMTYCIIKDYKEINSMQAYKEEISVRGKSVLVDSVRVENKIVITSGKLLKIARIKDEWYEDVEDPEAIIEALKSTKPKPDIFTFWQRLPETKPRYTYYVEMESIAALPITGFDHWWEKQVSTETRRNVKKADKKGVSVKLAKFDDDFIKGMTDIFNETPIRQGKHFWHYGKDYETVKREFSRFLYREDLIGAYYNDELIGFMFLSHAGKYALTGQIISKVQHRDKAPNNALIAKAVDICNGKQIPYLVYFYWSDDTLAEFKRRNGFEKTELPRYYIPLTFKGKLMLKLKLHHGVIGIIPDKLISHLKDLRKIFYTIINTIGSKWQKNSN